MEKIGLVRPPYTPQTQVNVHKSNSADATPNVHGSERGRGARCSRVLLVTGNR